MTLITNCSLALPATLNISITIHSVSSSTQSQLLTIPGRTSVLTDKNFIVRMLVYIAIPFIDNSILAVVIHCVTAFCLLFY